MTNTGYILLNGKGINLATPTATVAGFYKKAVAAVNTGKTIFVTDVVDGNLVMTNIPVSAVATDTTVLLQFQNKSITVTNEDAVTIQ